MPGQQRYDAQVRLSNRLSLAGKRMSCRIAMAAKPHRIGVGVAVGAEPQPQELLVDALRLLARRVPRRVALRQPVPAAQGVFFKHLGNNNFRVFLQRLAQQDVADNSFCLSVVVLHQCMLHAFCTS